MRNRDKRRSFKVTYKISSNTKGEIHHDFPDSFNIGIKIIFLRFNSCKNVLKVKAIELKLNRQNKVQSHLHNTSASTHPIVGCLNTFVILHAVSKPDVFHKLTTFSFVTTTRLNCMALYLSSLEFFLNVHTSVCRILYPQISLSTI